MTGNKLTATLSDGRTIEVEEHDGVLIPVKTEPKLRPAPEALYVHVCHDGAVSNAWKLGEDTCEADRIKSGEFVRYVRDDERYDKHEEWWMGIYDKKRICSRLLHSTQEGARAWSPSEDSDVRLVRVRVVEEVPHE